MNFLLQRSLRRPTEILVRQPVHSYSIFNDIMTENEIITFTWCCILGQRLDEPLVMFGDIAVDTGFMNADPCTSQSCKWEKSSDGNVYVPYVISKEYCKYFVLWNDFMLNLMVWFSYTIWVCVCVRVCTEFLTFLLLHWAAPQERSVIEGGLHTFAASTCVRFFPRTNQRDFVDIQSKSGYDHCILYY